MALPMPNISGNVPPLSSIKDVLVTVSTYLWLNRRSKSDGQRVHSFSDLHSNTLVTYMSDFTVELISRDGSHSDAGHSVLHGHETIE